MLGWGFTGVRPSLPCSFLLSELSLSDNGTSLLLFFKVGSKKLTLA